MSFSMINIWIGIMAVAVIAEIVTAGILFLWFFFGALAALILFQAGFDTNAQIMVFVTVTLLTMYFIRPHCVKYVHFRKGKHYAEKIIGQNVVVIAPIDNRVGEGRVLLDGMEWRARSARDTDTFEKGDRAVITEVDGIVLTVIPDTAGENMAVEG